MSRSWILFALAVAIPFALLPAWYYFAVHTTAVVTFGLGWSENASVAAAKSVVALPILCWIGLVLVWLFSLISLALEPSVRGARR